MCSFQTGAGFSARRRVPATLHPRLLRRGTLGRWVIMGAQVVSSAWERSDVCAKGHWEYRDKYDQVQGPFTDAQMCEWHKAGYFPESLPVRTVGSSEFTMLGKLVEESPGMDIFKSNRGPVQIGEEGISSKPDGRRLHQWQSAVCDSLI